MARIRMISVGSRGDLQPYLAILLELQRRGHQVTLIGSVNFQAAAEAHALPFVPLPGDFTSLLRSEAGLALMQGKPAAEHSPCRHGGNGSAAGVAAALPVGIPPGRGRRLPPGGAQPGADHGHW